MALTKKPNAEPIPGYRLLGPLGRGGFGEVWKCEAPGGLFKAIKFVDGRANGVKAVGVAMAQELEALHRIKAIRHPFLVSMDRIEVIGGELVIVMELADKNLLDLLQECQAAGKPGVPRDELLGYLWEAAEALDLMNIQYELQHLDIKPGNLFLVSNHVKVADFGLVNSLAGERGDSPASLRPLNITPRYAPPERFLGRASPASDQYSLAVVYQELLTGCLPFPGTTFAQLLVQHTKEEPDLRLLPASDRAAVARALSKDPAQRFGSCLDFVRALVAEETRAALRASSFARSVGPADTTSGLANVSADASETVSGDRPHSICRPAAGPPSAEEASLAGNQLVKSFGRNVLGEFGLVRAPDGRKRLVKYLYGFASPNCTEEWEALTRLLGFRHPGLSPFAVAQSDPTCVVLASGPFDQTLQECFEECRSQGRPGIPRWELLDYLHEVATVLDALFEEYQLAHLALSPHNLVLTQKAFLVADFGAVPLLFAPAGESVGSFNGRYAAPELLEGQDGRAADQYSLALIYQELLTGEHPHRGLNDRGSARTRRRSQLDLKSLADSDREVLVRALAPRPPDRFASCTHMIQALQAASREPAPHAAKEPSGRERRTQERLPFERPLQVFPVLTDASLGAAIEGRAKDISLNGVGLWLPHKPATPQVYVHLDSPDPGAPVAIRARVMRAHPSEQGGYEVGLLFLEPLEPIFLTGLLTGRAVLHARAI